MTVWLCGISRQYKATTITLVLVALQFFNYSVFGDEGVLSPSNPVDTKCCALRRACCDEIPDLLQARVLESLNIVQLKERQAPAFGIGLGGGGGDGTLSASTDKVQGLRTQETHALDNMPCTLAYEFADVWSSKRSKSCESSVRELIDFRYIRGEYKRSLKELEQEYVVRRGRENFQAQYADILLKYGEQCLQRLEELPSSCRRSSNVDNLLSVVGRFYRKGEPENSICAGLRVGKFVISARHCFIDKDIELSRLFEQAKLSTKDIVFQSLDESSSPVAVSLKDSVHPPFYLNAPETFDERQTKTDWIAVRVESDEDLGKIPSVRQRQAKSWDRLFFLGYQPNLIEAQKLHAAASGTPETVSVKDTIRVDFSPNCTAFFVRNGCIHHACQTEAGLSGSPIFAITRENRLFLLGVHVQGVLGVRSVQEQGQCSTTMPTAFPNIGIELPQQLLSRLHVLSSQ